MTKQTRRPGSFLLSMIAKARSDLPRDLTELSDAELIRSMAYGLSGFIREATPHSSDDDDFAAFACMFALGRAYAGYHPPSEGEDDALAVAENLLAEIGQEFDRGELRSIWRSDAFAEVVLDAILAVAHADVAEMVIRQRSAQRTERILAVQVAGWRRFR